MKKQDKKIHIINYETGQHIRTAGYTIFSSNRKFLLTEEA